ncbi:TPA: ABC transporter permease [Klebsiella pneumoniae]|uniref:ABC transporter permease n=2 Tax=Klebsiella pneumoniae TaxID=573 RepID=UPI000B953B3D|nr:ABC transporter permease [Klebsiella pneumoniae]MBM2678516.1 ABC transporter permease [Klebsiella pneumoniae]MBM6470092.1 ABC transporter permease [Klebsiella pneumoniae]MCQ8651547.1 ABC transporter permease [Klebsiella pneumoniae]MCS6411542.1 ABC transporter permease [Klebsiella pneumoniae]MDO3461872.1 ABC transporter permease [Klebsiella pneumoniae]
MSFIVNQSRELFKSLIINRRLIYTLTRREVISRYRGSVLGLLWSFFTPVLMLVVYTFVFSVVFQAKWSEGSTSRTSFALVLFSGLIIFNLFSECINKAPATILANSNYVKKVIFPLEILPWVNLFAALFHFSISCLVWIIFYTVEVGIPHLSMLLLPFILLPLILMIMGLSWFLASLGVYLRDVSQIVGIATMVLMFLSPIFFPTSALPESVKPLLSLNPLAQFIEQARDVMYWGRPPEITQYFVGLTINIVIAWAGFLWFQKTRKGFADVI